MRSEDEIKQQIEQFKTRQQNASIAGNHNGYFEIGMAIQALEWVLQEVNNGT
jgi:hypothetical protein